MVDIIFLSSLLAASLRLAVPVVITAEGEAIAERSGVMNIGIEGIALLGAFSATVVTSITRNPGLGVLAALLVGALAGAIHAVISLHPRGNQILSGIGLNTFALGFTAYGMIIVWGELFASSSPPVPKIPKIPLPITGAFDELSIFVVLMFILAGIIYFLIFKTRFGLRLRSVGENPAAADAAGLNVYRIRFIAVVIGGSLAALSGAYLVVDQQGRFLRFMATRGFIALAIVVFGNWNPFIILIGGLVFGFGEALVSRLAPALGVGIAPQFVQMVPLLLTIAIYSLRRKTVQPEALGEPFVKE